MDENEIICPKCGHPVMPSSVGPDGSAECAGCGSPLQIIDAVAYIPGAAFQPGASVEVESDAADTPPPFKDEWHYSNVERDPLYEDAVNYLSTCNAITIAMLARYFDISPERAAQLMQQLEEAGVVAPFDGVHPRKILIEHNNQLPGFLRRTLGQDAARAMEQSTTARGCTISSSGCMFILFVVLLVWLVASVLK